MTTQALHNPSAGATCTCSACVYNASFSQGANAFSPGNAPFSADVTPAAAEAEIAYISGATSAGPAARSFWTDRGTVGHKWGSPTPGTPAGTLTYAFDPSSNFTGTEMQTFREALALWAGVANVTFSQTTALGGVDIELTRGTDGGAVTLAPFGGGNLATIRPTVNISIDTSITGFDLSGSFNTIGGYGLNTIVHEIGHALGLGHGGNYNGSVDPGTQQLTQFDSRLWSIMSYIRPDDSSAKYASSETVTGTNWGGALNSTTWMPLDILSIQRLYGSAVGGALSGGQVFGYNTNITGDIRSFFDFTQNTTPIITLYDSGTNNTLDLSGVSSAATIDLRPGHFSSFDGLVNNLAIAFGTRIDAAIGGTGSNEYYTNADPDRITGTGRSNAVYFSGNRSAYAVDGAGPIVTVTFGSVSDTLVNVQSLVFADQTISLACFAAGTPILTQHGERAVEHLRPGDSVITPSGPGPIRWIGRRTIDFMRHTIHAHARPIIIHPHAFGLGLPRTPIRLSPEHAVLVGDALIPIGCLVNGGTIIQDAVCNQVTYFHIELDHHTVVQASGLETETWRDTGNRHMFENAASAAAYAGPSHPYRAVADAGPVIDQARAMLRKLANLESDEMQETTVLITAAGVIDVMVPARTTSVHLDSITCHHAPDVRTLGALIERVELDGQPIDILDQRLGHGMHAAERHGSKILRWTNGHATLNLQRAPEARHLVIEVAALAAHLRPSENPAF